MAIRPHPVSPSPEEFDIENVPVRARRLLSHFIFKLDWAQSIETSLATQPPASVDEDVQAKNVMVSR
jgi:hypothetical protein